jgi:ferritin-like metal-binding protein YciE
MATKPKRSQGTRSSGSSTGTGGSNRKTSTRITSGTISSTSNRSSRTSGSQARTGNGRSQTEMLHNLEDAICAELGDMLYAERELVKLLPRLASTATARKLRQALEWSAEQSDEHASRLERVFRLFDQQPEAETCEGMQGIVTEAEELLRKTQQGPVRDAMIIAAAQKAGHYMIAAYGTLCAWAEQVEEYDALRVLEDILDDKKFVDHALSRIAEAQANPQAGRGEGRFGRPERGRGGYGEERGSGRSRQDEGWRETERFRGRMAGRERGPEDY